MTDAIQISLRDGYGEIYSSDSVLALVEDSLRDEKTTFIFNFENVDIEDSSVFRPLLVCYQHLQGKPGLLKVRGLHGRTREVFELLTLDSLIPVDED